MTGNLRDAWRVLHCDLPQPPTFRIYQGEDGKPPMACDFIFVSESLKDRLRRMEIDGATQASDHSR